MAGSNPLEGAILRALARHKIPASSLAEKVGMAQTNFSLARHSQRSFPLPSLLRLLDLAGMDATEKVKVVEWIAFKQKIAKKNG